MAFEYKSNIRAKLTPNEEQLLKSIDDFLFSLGQYKTLVSCTNDCKKTEVLYLKTSKTLSMVQLR